MDINGCILIPLFTIYLQLQFTIYLQWNVNFPLNETEGPESNNSMVMPVLKKYTAFL